MPHEADGGEEQDGSEDVLHPEKVGQQRCSYKNEDGAHDDRAEHAPEQDTVLLLDVEAEGAEHEQEDEQVIDAERTFDEVAGKELKPALFALRLGEKQGKAEG